MTTPFHIIYRIELKAYIDDSGPTLCINTESENTARMLSKMLTKTVRTTLPKMSTAQMKDTGFIDGEFINILHNHHCQNLC